MIILQVDAQKAAMILPYPMTRFAGELSCRSPQWRGGYTTVSSGQVLSTNPKDPDELNRVYDEKRIESVV